MANVKKGTHEQNCLSVCISCLKKVKPNFLKPLVTENGENKWETLVSKLLFEDYYEEKQYLPQSICLACRLKLQNHKNTEEFPVFIDFLGLVNNVKKALSEKNENILCSCELCRVATATLNSKKSCFVSDTTVGRPLKKAKITDFFGESKATSKEEKIKELIQFTCSDSIEQLCSEYLKQKAKESNQSVVLLKSHRGSPLKVTLG